MRLGKGLLSKVRSSFQLARLTYAISGKKAQYHNELFSDNYHEEYCRHERLPDGSYLVESKDKGLFGVRGGLPNFILDWLKLSYHRGNEAFLSFLSHFEQRLIELRHKKARAASIIYRAEHCTDQKQQKALANQYFSTLNFEHTDYNIIPSTLLNRHASRSITSIHRMLGYYFPYKFDIKTDNLEWQVIPQQARSQLGKTQLGCGLILGNKYPQLSRKISIIIKLTDSEQFRQFSVADSQEARHLEQIKTISRQCFSEHASIEVIAQYTGERVNPCTLTTNTRGAIILGENAQLLGQTKNQLQKIRKH